MTLKGAGSFALATLRSRSRKTALWAPWYKRTEKEGHHFFSSLSQFSRREAGATNKWGPGSPSRCLKTARNATACIQSQNQVEKSISLLFREQPLHSICPWHNPQSSRYKHQTPWSWMPILNLKWQSLTKSNTAFPFYILSMYTDPAQIWIQHWLQTPDMKYIHEKYSPSTSAIFWPPGSCPRYAELTA